MFQQKKVLAKSRLTVLKVTQIQVCACNLYIKSDNLIFSNLNIFSKSTVESIYPSHKLLLELTRALCIRSFTVLLPLLPIVIDLRWYASCSFLFCISSVSVYFCQGSTKPSPLITARNGNLLLTKRMLFEPTDKQEVSSFGTAEHLSNIQKRFQ